MKKIIITLAILTASFTLFGQTDSLTVEEFVKLYEPLMSGYRENYESGKWKQTEKVLCEFDTIDFYHYYKATGKGINCSHLVITLNEII
jgi:hypothetical protein